MSHSNKDEPSTSQRSDREAEAMEHLANERTLLTWVRTGVGLISGIVVERAGLLRGEIRFGSSLDLMPRR